MLNILKTGKEIDNEILSRLKKVNKDSEIY